MEGSSFFLTLDNPDSPRSFKMLNFWNKLATPLNLLELENINVDKEHPGIYLKKHRLEKNLSMSKLSKEIKTCRHALERFEKCTSYPSIETSLKLARYFNLNTRYFYDYYLEDTHDIHIKLKNIDADLLSKKTGISKRNINDWIKGNKKPSRNSYYILKDNNIL